MLIFYYLIITATLYLAWCTWVNYRLDKIEKEISNSILYTCFKYKK